MPTYCYNAVPFHAACAGAAVLVRKDGSAVLHRLQQNHLLEGLREAVDCADAVAVLLVEADLNKIHSLIQEGAEPN